MEKRELIEYCLTYLSSYEDYPFDDGAAHADDGAWTVMRYGANKKGFAHIYKRNGQLCVNLKCEPNEADILRHIYKDVTPGYHMNKDHWNTVVIGGDVPDDELKLMIERSYNLIKPKIRRKTL